MVNRNLIREFDVSEEDWEAAVGALTPEDDSQLARYPSMSTSIEIVEGKIIRVDDEMVLVDVGYKSEGTIPRNEWEEEGRHQPEVGQTVRVLIEDVEDNHGPLRRSRDDRSQQAESGEDRKVDEGHGDRPRRRRRQRRSHAEDQGRFAGRHRRQRVLARQPGRHSAAARHWRIHRQDHRVHGAQDRRSAPQHRGQSSAA